MMILISISQCVKMDQVATIFVHRILNFQNMFATLAYSIMLIAKNFAITQLLLIQNVFPRFKCVATPEKIRGVTSQRTSSEKRIVVCKDTVSWDGMTLCPGTLESRIHFYAIYSHTRSLDLAGKVVDERTCFLQRISFSSLY